MELRERSALMIVFAAAGFFWLTIMLWLALADYVTGPPARRGFIGSLAAEAARAELSNFKTGALGLRRRMKSERAITEQKTVYLTVPHKSH